MGYPTAIEWTDATWNPVGGCSIASPGCDPCYAQKLAGNRLKHHPLYAGTTSPSPKDGRPIFNGTMTAMPSAAAVWTWPLRWRGAAAPKLGAGMPSLIFVGDMSDLFHEHRQLEQIDFVFAVMATAADIERRHIFQLLTKRSERMLDYFRAKRQQAPQWVQWRSEGIQVLLPFEGGIPSNIWLGVSAERQVEFDARWPHLRSLAEMGNVIFVSYEPAMGPLRLPADFLALGRRAQLIAGGCSGDRAWPAHPDWFRSVRDQCAAAGVPFFFKQWGEWVPSSSGVIETRGGEPHVAWPDGTIAHGKSSEHGGLGRGMLRVGKKAAGALLDGRTHRAFPQLPARAIGAAT